MSKDTLQEQARKILASLEGNHVPPDGLNYFTVGDSFRTGLMTLKRDVMGLVSSQRSLERLVIGGFGTGKTHFLNYLEWHLQKDWSPNCIISRTDLSDLNDPDELQFLFLKGMRGIGSNRTYADVLRNAYGRVESKLVEQSKGITADDIQHIFGMLLYASLPALTNGIINAKLLDIITRVNPLQRVFEVVTGKASKREFEKASKQVDPDLRGFVHGLLGLIRNPDSPLGAFEQAARELSKRKELSDLVFRFLRLSGTPAVLISVDEMETLTAHESHVLKRTLVQIRDFRDNLNRAVVENGYPSIGLVCAVTHQFFNDGLKLNDPALLSRWENEDKHIMLNVLSPVDIDNLIFKLRELHLLAGYSMRPVRFSIDGGDHEVIQLRKGVEPGIPTRKLISKLIRDVERAWKESSTPPPLP